MLSLAVFIWLIVQLPLAFVLGRFIGCPQRIPGRRAAARVPSDERVTKFRRAA